MSSSYQNFLIPNDEFTSNSFNNNKSNISNSNGNSNPNPNSLKIQLIKKDKIIMNNNKLLNEQKSKIQSLHQALEIKDKEIKKLKESMNEIQDFGDNFKKEKNTYIEKINSYKSELDKQLEERFNEQTNFNEQINDLTKQINLKDSKIKQNEKTIENLNKELKEKESEIIDQNEQIENYQLILRKNEDEKNEISSLNSKLIEYEERIRNYKCKINEMENNIQTLQQNNEELDSRLNNIIKETGNKESTLKKELSNLTNRNVYLEQNFKNQNEDFEKIRNKCDYLQKENEKFTSYITNKLNDFNDLIDTVKINYSDVFRLQNDFEKVYNQNDIKYEIVDDAFIKLKKNILQFFTEQKYKSEKVIQDYNELIKQKDISENIINNLNNEKDVLNFKIEEINKKNNDIIKNYESLNESYEKLKQLYIKLYNDYHSFTDKNLKLMNDTRIYNEKLNSYFQDLNFENKHDEYSPINEVLLQNIILFVNQYKEKVEQIKHLEKENSELKEMNDSQKNMTISKFKELTNLIEESKKIIKIYETENINLKTQLEKLNYQYKLLESQQTEE